MIYAKLENRFLGTTLKYNFNFYPLFFFWFSLLLFLGFGISSICFIGTNWHISLALAISFIVFFIVGLLLLLICYPRIFYYKRSKKNTVSMPKFSYRNLRELLFETSVDELVSFLYQEKLTQKTKVILLIKHYEGLKVVKTKFSFPFLILLSLLSSIILSLCALPEERIDVAIALLIVVFIGMVIICGELKLFYFFDILSLDTNYKYNFLLELLTEVYLNRYGKNSQLLKRRPE